MKYLLMVLMVIAATQVTASGLNEIIESLAERAEAASVSSEVEVVELFHAETPEELEIALTDGYPMPWLEEILNDESIPEEDRYWLDCRVRAAIAQDLHLFYDRDDNPVYVEADYIGPGEDYWREHMMVNPLGNNDVPDENRPTRALADPGYILDLFGNRVGQLAEVRGFVSLSRDASIAAVVSGGRTLEYLREPFACFMYPDGSFKEFQVETSGDYEAIVSSNGEIVVFQCDTPDGMYDIRTHERTDVVAETFIYDPYGNLIHSVSPMVLFGSGERVKISSTGRFICDNLSTGEVFLVDCAQNYSTSLITDRSNFNFNPNGNYLCLGGHSSGLVIDLDTFEAVWEADARIGQYDYVRVYCSNNAECIALTTRHGDNPDYYYELEVYLDNDLVHNDTAEGRYNEETVVSPNGHFLLTRQDNFGISSTSLPTVIRQIKREGSE